MRDATMAPAAEPLVVVAAADPTTLQEIGPLLRDCGCRVATAGDVGQLAAVVAAESPALLLLDPVIEADARDGILSRPGLSVALLGDRDANGAGETAVRRGAFDYLTWPLDPHRLRVMLAHAVERHQLLERIRKLEDVGVSVNVEGGDSHLRAIDRMEKGAIVDALRRVGGNVRQAARLLGFGQATVYRKIKRYKIALPNRNQPADVVPGFTPLPPDPARSFV
jgi:DNA-binding NtrC family response regulator